MPRALPGLVRNHKVCDILLDTAWYRRFSGPPFHGGKGRSFSKARSASRRDCQGSRRFANRWLLKIGSLIPRSPPILMGDWCSEEVTDTRTQRNYGNG